MLDLALLYLRYSAGLVAHAVEGVVVVILEIAELLAARDARVIFRRE